MPGDIDDVVRATHDPQIAILILKTSVGSLVVTRISLKIRLNMLGIFVPQRWQTTGRQRQLDHDVPDLVISYLGAFIIEHAHVVTRNRPATRSRLHRQQLDTDAVRADGPAGFRLPPMIDHGHAELSLSPRQRIRITTLAGQKQRAKFSQIVISQVVAGVILALDGTKSCRRSEKCAHTVLRDHAPERTRIRCADWLAFVKHSRVPVQQWSIDDVRVADSPTEIRRGPKDFTRLHAVNVLHGPLERDEGTDRK